MTWQAHIEASIDSANAHEAAVADEWADHLAWLEQREQKLRNALVALVLLLPFRGRRGALDVAGDRQAVRTFYRSAERVVGGFRREVARRFTGTGLVSFRQAVGTGSSPRRDTVRRALVAARQARVLDAWDRGVSLLAAQERGLLAAGRNAGRAVGLIPGPGAPSGGLNLDSLSPADRATLDEAADFFRAELESLGVAAPRDLEELARVVAEHLDEIEDAIVARHARDRDGPGTAGVVDIAESALRNLVRNMAYDLDRVLEQVRDFVAARPTQSQLVSHINGSPNPGATAKAGRRGASAGIALNRNNLRLSVEAHRRAAYRSSIVGRGDERGVRDHLLIVPRSRWSSIRPGGVLADHAYRLRPVDEWRRLLDRMNAERRSTGLWEGFGLHHGDPSVPVLVPAFFLGAAVVWADRERRRFLADIERRAA